MSSDKWYCFLTSDKFNDTLDLLLLQHLPHAVHVNFKPVRNPDQIFDMPNPISERNLQVVVYHWERLIMPLTSLALLWLMMLLEYVANGYCSSGSVDQVPDRQTHLVGAATVTYHLQVSHCRCKVIWYSYSMHALKHDQRSLYFVLLKPLADKGSC